MHKAEEDQRTAALLEELEELAPRSCPDCSRELCSHEYVMNVAMGFKNAPRCVDCLSTVAGREREDFLEQISAHIQRRTCYNAGWRWASEREGFNGSGRPPCLNISETPANASTTKDMDQESNASAEPARDACWDGGHMGCGDLVMELRLQLKSMKPGAVLKVTALDPGAPEDIPAWCGLTGQTLVLAKHPYYWIKRKED
jgi:tRNA 2-thiouridine synthesizing protein A